MPKNKNSYEQDRTLYAKRMNTVGLLLLFALLTQSAAAQETIRYDTIRYDFGFDIDIPKTNYGLTWLWTDTTEYYPNRIEYEAAVDELLMGPPSCLDTNAYARKTKSFVCDINMPVRFKWERFEPDTLQRPHNDPRVVENWEQEWRIQGGIQIIQDLTTGKSFGGNIDPFGFDPSSIGGRN